MSLVPTEAKAPVHPAPAPDRVTTGPITGSRKVYAAPRSHPHLRVPFREIALGDPKEPPVRVYDPSGPYTESDSRIDLAQGLPAVREGWIAARGFDAVAGRVVRPEDNGNLPDERVALPCPAHRILRAGRDGQTVTQYEFACAGIVTEEMVYVAHRENLAREAAHAGAETRIADGESFGAAISRLRDAGIRARARSARGRAIIPANINHVGARADHGDRPQFPGESEREHRQFGGHLRRPPTRSRNWSGRSAGAPTPSWTSRPAATSTTSATGSSATRRCRSARCRSTKRSRRSDGEPGERLSLGAVQATR